MKRGEPKFKIGDIVIDNMSKDVAIILGIDEGYYNVDCIDPGERIYPKGVDQWAIYGVDNRSSLHESCIIDKVLNKYL